MLFAGQRTYDKHLGIQQIAILVNSLIYIFEKQDRDRIKRSSRRILSLIPEITFDSKAVE